MRPKASKPAGSGNSPSGSRPPRHRGILKWLNDNYRQLTGSLAILGTILIVGWKAQGYYRDLMQRIKDLEDKQIVQTKGLAAAKTELNQVRNFLRLEQATEINEFYSICGEGGEGKGVTDYNLKTCHYYDLQLWAKFSFPTSPRTP
jgi:hypothetical protein